MGRVASLVSSFVWTIGSGTVIGVVSVYVGNWAGVVLIVVVVVVFVDSIFGTSWGSVIASLGVSWLSWVWVVVFSWVSFGLFSIKVTGIVWVPIEFLFTSVEVVLLTWIFFKCCWFISFFIWINFGSSMFWASW